MNKIILIVLLLSIATSGAFCSIFNTKCKKDCKNTFLFCVTGFDSAPLEVCSEALGTCLYNCILHMVDLPSRSPAVH
ncbi:hypothetical protein DDB_G0275903 [Dictyostelium discoideum AX4]|uniref:Uncharacterized protein n=1 Tax=Dictyostelium discoideum TaxID=44689 RepID=Q552V4_DICDI|nr:hypothetical protein DDB_G0275903 [Dictyostelium discoideum AX4]EAL69702.1 hypothetical protein DDB_G0275903 [Dictyostelium discoideum AX4]|eukprot:XP_643577.1 hypothetical protein DDB_G0275903 [Dictyostelium discoideum AX4]